MAPSNALGSMLGITKTAFSSISRSNLRFTVLLEKPASLATAEYIFLGSLARALIISASVRDNPTLQFGNRALRRWEDFAPASCSMSVACFSSDQIGRAHV